jgi:hypothetical protein
MARWGVAGKQPKMVGMSEEIIGSCQYDLKQFINPHYERGECAN